MATYNSSEISRGIPARSGVYPVGFNGVVNIGNVTIGINDTCPLVYIPFGMYLADFKLIVPNVDTTSTIRWSLLDNMSSVTTYASAQTWGNNATTWFNMVTSATAGIAAAAFGTIYGATARSIGSSGAPVVVWASGKQLMLKATTGAGAATGGTVNIQFQGMWAPAYDMGT